MTATISIDTTTQRYTSAAQPEPDVDCLHTTEGMSWPAYGGGGSAPHGTIRALPGKGIAVREHISTDQYAKSLMNLPGGVETNRRGVLQYELMGTCDPIHRGDPAWYYWPDADDVVIEALANYLKPIHARYAIPAVSPTFLAYPASYGNKAGQRLSTTVWTSFNGIVGHQHVPENDHGDPGSFPIAKLIAKLSAASPAPPVVVPPVVVVKPVPTLCPAFPLPRGWYFGPATGPRECVSGYYNRLPSGRRGHPGLLAWQKQMIRRGWRLIADGLYDDQDRRVALQFGAEKRVAGARDDLIGPAMWAEAWHAPVT